MLIVGCDFHPSWQQIAWLDTETGETGEQKLLHAGGEAQQFYGQLPGPALIGMEATGNSQWFIELVEDLGHELWIGDAAQIRARYVRKQKTDKRDAGHILKLVVEGRFPRLWAPDRDERDLRQLVLHRHKLVLIRARVKNELQHLSLNKGMQRKRKLWSAEGLQLLRALPLKPWASCRREDLLGLLAMLDQQVRKLDEAVQQAAEAHAAARLLMTQPGVGPNTALAFVLTIGDVSRDARAPNQHLRSSLRRPGASPSCSRCERLPASAVPPNSPRAESGPDNWPPACPVESLLQSATKRCSPLETTEFWIVMTTHTADPPACELCVWSVGYEER